MLIWLHTDVEASAVEDASLALVFSAFSTSLAICAAMKKLFYMLTLFIRMDISDASLLWKRTIAAIGIQRKQLHLYEYLQSHVSKL